MSAPICICPASIRCPPNQSTATLETFSTSRTVGNMNAISRPTRSAVSVRSALPTPKRSRSAGSRTNARTTRMPVICSRRMRLTTSIRVCMRRNCGTILLTISAIAATSTVTLTTMSQDRPTSSRSAMMMPPTQKIGADTISVNVSSASICTCWTSLVERVISDGAPNRLTSRAEKEPTRWKTAARASRPNAIAVRAPKYTATIEATIWTTVTDSIMPPVRRM